MDEKTADHWLNKACAYELEGKTRHAEMALGAAIRADDAEHKSGGNPSLPRQK